MTQQKQECEQFVIEQCEIYTDWINNFISTQGYADYYHLTLEDTQHKLAQAKEVYTWVYG